MKKEIFIFYVNKCGFYIIEFYHKFHPDPNRRHDVEKRNDSKEKKEGEKENENEPEDEMFRFQKIIKK